MLTLHKFVPAWGQPDMSPFCIKVETYLRMAGIPFRPVITDARRAPKRKLPYIDDGGTILCDSRDIVERFERTSAAPLDAGLSARDRAVAFAFRSLFEEELYFMALYLRWQLDEGWRTYQPVLRAYGRAIGVPRWLGPLILPGLRRDVVRRLAGQGMGRHTAAEVDARMGQALEAVSVQLGQGPYFLGAGPRTIDATAYAFLTALLETPFESPALRQARSLENLAAYCFRIRATYFGGAEAAPTAPAKGAPRPSAPEPPR